MRNWQQQREIFLSSLKDNGASKEKPSKLKEDEFRFDHNEDAMATEKLSEGIRNFVIDQNKLEDALSQKL